MKSVQLTLCCIFVRIFILLCNSTYQTVGMLSTNWGTTSTFMSSSYDSSRAYPSSKLQQSSTAASGEASTMLQMPYFIDAELWPFSSVEFNKKKSSSGREVSQNGESRVGKTLPNKPKPPIATLSTDVNIMVQNLKNEFMKIGTLTRKIGQAITEEVLGPKLDFAKGALDIVNAPKQSSLIFPDDQDADLLRVLKEAQEAVELAQNMEMSMFAESDIDQNSLAAGKAKPSQINGDISEKNADDMNDTDDKVLDSGGPDPGKEEPENEKETNNKDDKAEEKASKADPYERNIPTASELTVESKEEISTVTAGIGSYFDQMGGVKTPQPSKPSTEVKKDASAQTPGVGSYFDQMGGAKPPQTSVEPSTEVKIDASSQTPGVGSYFDQMGGAKPPQTSVEPSTEVKKGPSAQTAGIGSYFDQMGGAKPPQTSVEASTEVKKGPSAQTAGIGSYFDQMGGAKAPKPTAESPTETKKDISAPTPGIGSYFDQMGGAKAPKPTAESPTETKKDISVPTPGMGSYFDQMGSPTTPKPTEKLKKDNFGESEEDITATTSDPSTKPKPAASSGMIGIASYFDQIDNPTNSEVYGDTSEEAKRLAADQENERQVQIEDTQRVKNEWRRAADRIATDKEENAQIIAATEQTRSKDKEEYERIASEKVKIEKNERFAAENLKADRIVAAAEETKVEETERVAAEEKKIEEEKRIDSEKAAAAEEAKVKEAELVAAEEAKIEEEQRIDAEKVAAEEAKLEEAERVAAEEAKIEEEKIVAAEKAAAAEKTKIEEAERVTAEETRIVEEKRIDTEKAAAAEEAKLEEAELVAAEEAKIEEEKREDAEKVAAEEAKLEEAERVAAEETKIEEEKIVAAQKAAAEDAKVEEAERVTAEETRIEEEKRVDTEKAAAAAKTKVEEAERVAAEETKIEEEKRIDTEKAAAAAEEARMEEEKGLAKEKAKAERTTAEDARKREEQYLAKIKAETEQLAVERAAAEEARIREEELLQREKDETKRLAVERAATEQARIKEEEYLEQLASERAIDARNDEELRSDSRGTESKKAAYETRIKEENMSKVDRLVAERIAAATAKYGTDIPSTGDENETQMSDKSNPAEEESNIKLTFRERVEAERIAAKKVAVEKKRADEEMKRADEKAKTDHIEAQKAAYKATFTEEQRLAAKAEKIEQQKAEYKARFAEDMGLDTGKVEESIASEEIRESSISLKEAEDRIIDQKRKAEAYLEPNQFSHWATQDDEIRKNKRLAKDAERINGRADKLEKIAQERRSVTKIAEEANTRAKKASKEDNVPETIRLEALQGEIERILDDLDAAEFDIRSYGKKKPEKQFSVEEERMREAQFLAEKNNSYKKRPLSDDLMNEDKRLASERRRYSAKETKVMGETRLAAEKAAKLEFGRITRAKIDAERILAKKIDEESRIDEEMCALDDIAEEAKFEAKKAMLQGDMTEVRRLVKIQAEADRMISKTSSEKTKVTEERRQAEEIFNELSGDKWTRKGR